MYSQFMMHGQKIH